MRRDRFEDDGLGDDWLTAHAGLVEPARNSPTLSVSAVTSLARQAMAAHEKPPVWSRSGYRLSAVGALASALAAVVAVSLASGGTGPSLPAQAQAPAQLHYFVPGGASTPPPDRVAKGVFAGCPFEVRWVATPGPRLSRRPGTQFAYELASASPYQAILQLQHDLALGTSTHPYRPGPSTRYWRIGPESGPSLSTSFYKGITYWSYLNVRQPARTLVREAGRHGRHLPSDARAASMARSYFARLESSRQFGAAVVIRTSTSVTVNIPIDVRGLVTDHADSITYNGRARIATASGVRFRVVRALSYPTVSPTLATEIANQPAGALVALIPPHSPAAYRHLPKVRRPVIYSPCGPEVGKIAVAHASMSLTTAKLQGDRSWLLPSWSLWGVVHAGWSPGRQNATVSTIAIYPQFLRFLPAPIVRYRPGRGTL
jgi:hypothetical protein